MAAAMVTPLQPGLFFTGTWIGEGDLIPHPAVRWLVPKESVSFVSRTTWLSDTIWVVRERFEFSSGNSIPRTMFVEIVAADRLHVTADDMPLGADIFLQEKGFRFSPYFMWAYNRGRRWQLRCLDENVIGENGTIHDTIQMFLWGFPVATMSLVVNRIEG